MSSPRAPTVLASLCLCACPSGSADEVDAGSSPTSTSSATQSTATTDASTDTQGDTEPDTGTETGTDTDTDPPRPARLVMTADWRAKRLSLLDYAALRDGAASRDEALWKTIELDAWEPGPLEAELSPDGSLAVVAVAPGFFGGPAGSLAGAGIGAVPEGGGLLIIDVDAGVVVAELQTAQYPMGIAITPDGSAAWTANYGGNGQSGSTVSHIDLASLSIIEEFEVGPGPEQLALADDLAIINTAGDGSIRLFDLSDPAGTLSPSVVVSNDPSWVLHVGSGGRAVAINSVGAPGYSLLDTQDPQDPLVLDTIEVSGIPYAATRAYDDDQILMSVITGTETSLQLWNTATSELVDQIVLPAMGFPLGLAFVAEDGLALVPIPGANVLAVADFGTGEHRLLDWQAVPGPTYVALEGP